MSRCVRLTAREEWNDVPTYVDPARVVCVRAASNFESGAHAVVTLDVRTLRVTESVEEVLALLGWVEEPMRGVARPICVACRVPDSQELHSCGLRAP